MNKFIEIMDLKVAPVAAKIGNLKYIKAISTGMMSLLGIIIIASLSTLVQNLQIPAYQDFLMNTQIGQSIWNVCQNITWGTLNMYALLICMSIGQSLWKSYDHKGHEGGALALAAYLITVPWMAEVQLTQAIEQAYGWIHYSNFSATALFTCMIVALISVEILHRLTKVKKLKVKMPDSVPPAVSDSFSTLFPIALTIIIFGILTFLVTSFTGGKSLNELINIVVAAPLKGFTNNVFAAIFIPVLISFLWFFGIHGSNIMGPIVGAVLGQQGMENIEMYAQGVTDWSQYNVLSPEFLAAFVYMGGAGCTIALLISMFIVNRRRHKVLLALAGPTGVFNINEPLIFGLPIILNPMLFIPFIIVPGILGAVSYFAVSTGLVHPVVATVPWTTPPILRAFFATGMHWTGAALAIVNLAIAVGIYLPFVKLMDRQEEITE
ncbi:MAG: PTS sugar transporter subunit IIC [Clostridium sp.]